MVATRQGNLTSQVEAFQELCARESASLAGCERPQQESCEIGGLYMGLATEAVRPLGPEISLRYRGMENSFLKYFLLPPEPQCDTKRGLSLGNGV